MCVCLFWLRYCAHYFSAFLVVICSQLSLFVLLPFSYFYYEAGGRAGTLRYTYGASVALFYDIYNCHLQILRVSVPRSVQLGEEDLDIHLSSDASGLHPLRHLRILEGLLVYTYACFADRATPIEFGRNSACHYLKHCLARSPF